MKKLFTLGFIVLLFNAKSYSQTQQFPFYGFELSNYEVGDSLEYQNKGNVGSDITMNVIIKKELSAGSDSITYTIRQIVNSTYFYNQTDYYTNTADTIKSLITNDTVYNDSNNVLHFLLYRLDTTQHWDTSFVKYDTLNGLKRIQLRQEVALLAGNGYEALQNIGVVHWYIFSDDINNPNDDHTLIYAHLANYGQYGSYSKLIDNIKEPSAPESSVRVIYDNGIAYLLISSFQNQASPTLTVYDLLGRPLESLQAINGINSINLNSFAKGMYLYKVTSNGNVLGQGKLMNL